MATWSTQPAEHFSLKATTTAPYPQSVLVIARSADGNKHTYHYVAPFTVTLGPFEQSVQWECVGLHRQPGSTTWEISPEKVVGGKSDGVYLQYGVEAGAHPHLDEMTVHFVKWTPQAPLFDDVVVPGHPHVDLDTLRTATRHATPSVVQPMSSVEVEEAPSEPSPQAETAPQTVAEGASTEPEPEPETTTPTPVEETGQEETQQPVAVESPEPAPQVETPQEPPTAEQPAPQPTPQPAPTPKPAAQPSAAETVQSAPGSGKLPDWLADMTGQK